MILQTLTTLLLTLSIGISANTNDFNNEKKSHKNIDYEEVGLYINETYEKTQTITYNNETLDKWKITNSNANYVYTNPYLIIANTQYTLTYTTTPTYKTRQLAYYQITNVYEAQVVFNVESSFITAANDSNTSNLYQTIKKINGTCEVINLTINNTTWNRLIEYNEEVGGQIIVNSNSTPLNNEGYINTTTTEITLNASETITLIYDLYRTNTTSPYQSVGPREITITGNVNIPTATYEVVDIPNLIFTILSMPFTFISQAFNLTIFPNTPYQINFSNLFMTIIAIFVMLWLIKHIFGK